VSPAPLAAIVHRPDEQRFVARIADATAECAYRRDGATLVLHHTEVPPALQGQGLAAELVAGVLAQARAAGWKVRPVCGYVRAYMRRHPATQDLLG
jgi:hypothetical protein